MDLTNILTIAALILNFIALCVVAYQTNLNRKSLDLANQNYRRRSKNKANRNATKSAFHFQRSVSFEKVHRGHRENYK